MSWPEGRFGDGDGTAEGSSRGLAGELVRDAALAGSCFYDRLQSVLIEGGFDAFAEAVCRPFYAARMGAPSVPPGRTFRMHLVGYFEGIASERGLAWRCSDSLSLRAFLRLESRARVPDHSWLSMTRGRLPHAVHEEVFNWVLSLIADAGLVKGEGDREMLERLGADERHGDAHGRGPGAPGSGPQGQEALQRGLGPEKRPRGQDCQDAKIAKIPRSPR